MQMRCGAVNDSDSLRLMISWRGAADGMEQKQGSGQRPGWKPDAQPPDFMTLSTSEAVGARLRILHLEESAQVAALIRDALESEGIACEIHWVQTRRDFQAALGRGGYDLVLSDDSLPSFAEMSASQLARQQLPSTPCFSVSGMIGEERAVEAQTHDAVNYLPNDRWSRLVSTVRRTYRESQNRKARSRVEEELRQRNELLRQITDNVEDLIEVLDLAGRRIFISPSCASLFGEPRTLIGSDAFADIHRDDRERIWQAFQETLITGQGRRVEYRCVPQDGGIRHLESQRSVVRDQAGQVAYVVVVSRDVTEREHAAWKIREQATLLEQAPDAIFVRDLDHRITY